MQTINWKDTAEQFEFYGKETDETLNHQTLDDFIYEELLDDISNEELIEKLDEGGSLYAYGYKRLEVKREWCSFLEDLLEKLNNDHELGDIEDGDWDGLSAESRAIVEKAEQDFIDVFLKRYKPWGCESVAKIEIPVRELFESMSKQDRLDYFGRAE
jgi:hypothetical protein